MFRKTNQKKIILLITVIILIIIGIIFYYHNKTKSTKNIPPTPLGPKITETTIKNEAIDTPPVVVKEPEPIPLPVGTDRFIVAIKDTNENIASNLFDQGYIKNKEAFSTLLSGKDGKSVIAIGAYKISKEMSEMQLIQALKQKPYMKWVVIPEGLRKEEIAKLLANSLGWSKTVIDKWIKIDTTKNPQYLEGVYSPDTYLIPVDEKPENVANRLIAKFNEKFTPYLPQFTTKNIKWTTAITLASIVQREAANDDDTALIAGILWNRLNQNMQLGVDATLQYIRGDKGSGWWAPITVTDKKLDSPYNTYLHTGLPPHPIANPGLPAIKAVLNPTPTDCLYYLHDKSFVTHCAKTYEEHLANIVKYLK